MSEIEDKTPVENERVDQGRRLSLKTLALGFFAIAFGGKIRNALAHSSPEATDECSDVAKPDFVDLESYQGDNVRVYADPVYAGRRNFTGEKVNGYEATKLLLPPDLIEKLKRATDVLQEEMRQIFQKYGLDPQFASGFRILVKDGYRPHRGTHALVKWCRENRREDLLRDGYVANNISGHNSGRTIDLTLGYLHGNGTLEEVWMGATFDEFDPVSHHGAGGRTLEEKDKRLSYREAGYFVIPKIPTLQLRNALRKAMRSVGGNAYIKEYWHYIFGEGPCYDVPIR